MKKGAFASCVVLACVFAAWLYFVTPGQRAERMKGNQKVFDTIKERTKWDMASDMHYEYAFINRRELPLRILGFLFSLGGHRVVDLSKGEGSDYWLHIEKVERHDVFSVSGKEVRLKRIGMILMSEYDGWEVGPKSLREK